MLQKVTLTPEGQEACFEQWRLGLIIGITKIISQGPISMCGVKKNDYFLTFSFNISVKAKVVNSLKTGMNILNYNILTPATQNTDEFRRCDVEMKEARHRTIRTFFLKFKNWQS